MYVEAEDNSKVYREIFEILKHFPTDVLNKIPLNLIETIKENMDKNYDYKIEDVENFENQMMHNKTRSILAILYREYWVDEDKRIQILERDRKQIIEYEESLKKNIINNIFEDQYLENSSKQTEKHLIVNKENNFLTFIKRIFKKIKDKIREKKWI